MDRICNEALLRKVTTPRAAAAHIKNGMTVGFSGFTVIGYPKVLPVELARRAEELFDALVRAGERHFTRAENRLESGLRALLWLSPERVLLRADERFADAAARLSQAAESFLFRLETRFAALERALPRAGAAVPERAEKTLSLLDARLAALDPRRPLERGYALVRLEDGRFARGVRDARPGEQVEILVRDGALAARILHVTEENSNE